MGDPVATKPFSWGAWIGGFLIALIAGLIGNLVLGFLAIDMRIAPLRMIVELIPGTILVLLSIRIRRRREAFEQGVLAGAAIVLLIGGLCGATLSGIR